MVSTARRVPKHTSADVNARIRQDMIQRIRHYADHPDEIEQRLAELDREWDIERAIEANASTLALTGIVLGATGDRRWLVLPALVTAFLLQHAVQGWCPPVPVLRRMGFRTADEINQERYALKVISNDPGGGRPGSGDPAGGATEGAGRLKAILKLVGLNS